MGLEGTIDALSQQTWLDKPAQALQGAVRKIYDSTGTGGLAVMNFMHGTWLGHPLHPSITDIPIGAWTASLVLDFMDTGRGRRKGLEKAADATVALGVAAALFAAEAGVTDWHRLRGDSTRRLGMLHALLNTGAVLLQTTSLVLRGNGARAAGRGASLLAYGVVTAGAYLGGHLTYSERIGTDHTSDLELPEEFVTVMPAAELLEGELRRVEANGVPVLLHRQGGEIHAMVETCSHMAGPLAEGSIEEGTVRCPWHGSRYSLEDGKVHEGPSAYRQPYFETRVRNGQIEVKGLSSSHSQS